MKKVLLLVVAFVGSLSAQSFPDTVVGGGLQFDQTSKPQSQGLMFFAKNVDKTRGVYNYNLLRITSITFDKKLHTVAVQKQAETGVAVYIKSFNLGPSLGVWDCSTAVTGGAAIAGGDTGLSASGTFFCSHLLGKSIYIAPFFGPSYSALSNGGGTAGVSYPVGLTFFWGGSF